ncbi:MAG: hypothetical protein RBQ88_12440 [Desulfobulbus oligotrophicus]|nr:hypothetical protein [Desulfobulbus oligotrophicus]
MLKKILFWDYPQGYLRPAVTAEPTEEMQRLFFFLYTCAVILLKQMSGDCLSVPIMKLAACSAFALDA